MKEWLRSNMDPDLLAADEELVEVQYGIDNPDDAPYLVEEEAVVGIEVVGEMEIDDAVETNEEAMADDAVVTFEEALCQQGR